jgi:catechol 2,3-dioxygenase-like lactoylglutathione lyase family enzyme
MPEVLRVTHIGICVADLERSIRFYRDLLGFQYLSELRVAGEPTNTLLELSDVDLRAVYLERDGVRIELLNYASPPAEPPPRARRMNEHGLTHLSFRVTELAALKERLRSAGVKIVDRTYFEFPAFEAAAVMIEDPDGQRIELVQAPGDPAAPPSV